MSAQQAYQQMIDEIFKNDPNPTYELCGITIENMFDSKILASMEIEGFIKYRGINHNGHEVYQIRHN